MITPSYGVTASERVLPRLALDFTTANLDPRVTFSRALNTATRINSLGVIELVNADLPRFDYDATTLMCKGLLVEEARTNLLLNCLIDGTSLATQSVTVTAAAHTISFYGTGTVELTGTHTATVNGTGEYPTRTTLTFTPTAGSLTLTVTGTVQFANLELGSFATSFIPTAGATVTRNADIATMTGTNFSDWFNASEGTFAAWGVPNRISAFISVDDGTSNQRIQVRHETSRGQLVVSNGGVLQANILTSLTTFPLGTFGKVLAAYKNNFFRVSANGSALATDDSGSVPAVNVATIGSGVATGSLCGPIAKLMYWPQSLTEAEIQAFSK